MVSQATLKGVTWLDVWVYIVGTRLSDTRPLNWCHPLSIVGYLQLRSWSISSWESIGHIGIEEVQLGNTHGPACAHSGGARLYAKFVGGFVKWNGLGLAGSTKRNIGRNGVLVGCIRENLAGFSIRADAQGGHYCARVGQTYFGSIHRCMSWDHCRSVYWFRCYQVHERANLNYYSGAASARAKDGCLPCRAWS